MDGDPRNSTSHANWDWNGPNRKGISRAYGSDDMSRLNKTTLQRFFDNTIVSNGCWLWNGGVSDNGYGNMSVGGKKYLAHRISFELFVGPIPEGSMCLHSCDNRSCVNPGHLRLGDSRDNHRDMAMRYRGSRSKRGLPFGAYPCNKKYGSHVWNGKKLVYLGVYDTPEQAHKVAIETKQEIMDHED